MYQISIIVKLSMISLSIQYSGDQTIGQVPLFEGRYFRLQRDVIKEQIDE